LRVVIGTEQGINRLSKSVLKYVPIPFDPNPDLNKADIIILLDTNTVQQLGNLADKLAATKSPIIVIDHHAIHPKTKLAAKISITDESSSSTCEIVYKFYKELNIKPNLNVAKALFLGIASDTRHFVLGNASTFKTISELGEIGVNPQEALASLSKPVSFSERIARIKACRRARVMTIDKWIIAFSNVGSYQASAARAMIDLGAHMATVAGQKGDRIEMSLRCSNEFNKKTGMHLGKDIAQPLGEYIQGMGGGHASAAGLNGKGEVENALNQCLVIIKKYLSNQP
ncbi:MAG: DHH family phosphoesterase, partial [Candidatus Bathyarchaeota archaeon]|nr:DHH family phosphoesterase [Candidatus Bathyarchaeota archaeon]